MDKPYSGPEPIAPESNTHTSKESSSSWAAPRWPRYHPRPAVGPRVFPADSRLASGTSNSVRWDAAGFSFSGDSVDGSETTSSTISGHLLAGGTPATSRRFSVLRLHKRQPLSGRQASRLGDVSALAARRSSVASSASLPGSMKQRRL